MLAGRVLVAEDNPVNQSVVRAILESFGVDADFVADGAAALASATVQPGYDLVLMDLQMPIVDGLSATRRIRAWERVHDRPRTPIVAVTASAYEENRQQCLASGMDDFLAKPIAVEQLGAVLEKWLRRN